MNVIGKAIFCGGTGEVSQETLDKINKFTEKVIKEKQMENAKQAKNKDMDFGEALKALKNGSKLARKKWNGKNMFIVYMPPLYLPPFNTADTSRKVNDRTAKWIGEDKPLDCQPYIAMYNAQEQWIPGWLASQSDMLDEDWYIVNNH